MIRPDQIPDAVVEAAARADYEDWRKREDLYDETLPWEEAEEEMREDCRASARAAILAALSTWPDSILMPAELILPLPQKDGDA